MASKDPGSELSAYRDAMFAVLSEAEVHRLQAHPDFDAVARESNRNATLVRSVDPILFDAFRQMGRFFAACMVLYLAASPGGLTYQRLGALMSQVGIAGFGRVQALILHLRAIGYIEPLAGPDGREKRYGPTRRMKDTFHRRFHQELQLGQRLELVCGEVADRFDDPAVFDAFMVAFGQGLIGGSMLGTDGPTLAVFSDRTGGFTILAHMMASADDGGALFPTVGPIPITVYSLAKAANVSRRQVRLVQEAAAETGFLLRDGDGPWIFGLALAHQARYFVALRVLSLAYISRQTLTATGAVPGTILA